MLNLKIDLCIFDYTIYGRPFKQKIAIIIFVKITNVHVPFNGPVLALKYQVLLLFSTHNLNFKVNLTRHIFTLLRTLSLYYNRY